MRTWGGVWGWVGSNGAQLDRVPAGMLTGMDALACLSSAQARTEVIYPSNPHWLRSTEVRKADAHVGTPFTAL